ncbi:hypothetical protein BaRGS_00018182, partial [Batillaria attramentaria]
TLLAHQVHNRAACGVDDLNAQSWKWILRRDRQLRPTYYLSTCVINCLEISSVSKSSSAASHNRMMDTETDKRVTLPSKNKWFLNHLREFARNVRKYLAECEKHNLREITVEVFFHSVRGMVFLNVFRKRKRKESARQTNAAS